MVEFVMQPRAGVGEIIDACARGKIGFDECCRRIAAMGYKTTSVFEMVVAAERAISEHIHEHGD